MSNTHEEKLERLPQPNRYCSICMGYGFNILKNYNLVKPSKPATLRCGECGGSGWVYDEDK